MAHPDRLGNVRPDNVSNILDEILDFREQYGRSFSALYTKPLCLPYWRGRMGTDKDEQLRLANIATEKSKDEKPLTPHPSRT